MDHIVLFEELERIEELNGKSSHKAERQALKVVEFQELVQVDAHQLKRNAQVLSKDHKVFHVDDIHGIVWIILFKILQNFEFDTSLIVILLLVLDDFDSHIVLCLVIVTLDRNAE